MKIIAIIPTLNEADNIKYITQVVDKGLQQIAENNNALIINADSNSTDQTQEFFLKTKTHFPKKTLLSKKPGKGRNIFEVLKLYSNKADYFIMMDADVTSAKSSWVINLLKPLIEGRGELSIPIYKRNRYEGNTTNHFSSPLIYTCLGKYIIQPIAGDFAFSKRLAEKIKTAFCNPSDYGYGVDTLITWTALLNKFSVKQVKLDRKIHKPSFPKIEPMFEQVCFTTLSLLNRNRKKIMNIILQRRNFSSSGEEIIDNIYINPPQQERLVSVERVAHKLTEKYKIFDINTKTSKEHLNVTLWTDILSKYVKMLLEKDFTPKEINYFTRSLSGYYLLRVLGYFDEIKDIKTNEINQLLSTQRNLLRKKVLKEISP